MRSCLPPAPRLASTLLLVTLVGALPACASRPVAFLDAPPCSDLIPEGWWCKDGQSPTPEKPCGVASAEPPDKDTVGDWIAFGDAQGGQLDKANGRGSDTMTIIEKCEAWHKAAADRLKPRPWWKFWTPPPDG